MQVTGVMLVFFQSSYFSIMIYSSDTAAEDSIYTAIDTKRDCLQKVNVVSTERDKFKAKKWIITP